MIHPLVRELYKQVIHVGRDYPGGLDYVRRTWKKALQNPQNCPSCYSYSGNGFDGNGNDSSDPVAIRSAAELSSSPTPANERSKECEKEIRLAVARGRHMVREMVGVVQLKKYRSMKKRYDKGDDDDG